MNHSNESSRRVHSYGTVRVVTEEFIFLQTKSKRVTTQMKVLGEYIIVAMFTEES